MNLKNVVSAAIVAAMVFMSQGCAIIFSPKRQYVTIKTATPGATIYFDGDSVGTGTARVRLNKYRVYNTITVKKEGYKSRNYCVTLKKYSPTIALAALDVLGIAVGTAKISQSAREDGSVTFSKDVIAYPGIILASLLYTDFLHVKTHNYEKKPLVPALEPYKLRTNDEKYLLVNKTELDMKSRDQLVVSYGRLSKYYQSAAKAKKGKSYTHKDLKVDNTVFTGSLNYTLRKMQFVDTTNSIFPSIGNCLYLNATIKRVTFHEVKSPYLNSEYYHSGSPKVMPNHLFAVELAVDWDILDFYKQKVASIHTVEKSDLFTIAYRAGESEVTGVVYNALKDNMDLSIMSLRRQLADKGLLKTSEVKESISVMELDRPQQAERRKDDFVKSCVVIKSGDEVGSGAIISRDGYIVTNYHVVAGAKKITVVFNDTTTAEAEVVRKNAEADMALLKVKKDSLTPFVLSEDNDPEVGIDVWAVGVAGKVEVGATLTHGIISGVRKTHGMTMLQTDAGINKGNSGSALVNEKGAAIGIVSLKIMGLGVEGLGFALSAHDVMEKLALKYK